ncbi:MAG: hypothetical protein K6L80_15400 [Agarilytica sp.]
MTFTVVIIVLLFSVVQSMLGVGLLVFGTPTLLLLGYSFSEALVTLLPASLVISVLQILQAPKAIREYRYKLPLFTLPFVISALAAVFLLESAIDLSLVTGVMLLLTALTRLSKRLDNFLRQLVLKSEPVYLALTGTVHGLSNMGGAFLTIFVSSKFSEKLQIRSHVAYGYLFFSLAQLSVIFMLDQRAIAEINWVLPVCSGSIFFIVHYLAFKTISEPVFHKLVTLLISGYGAVLVGQSLI